MKYWLSKDEIQSYSSDVVPLQVKAAEALSTANIEWHAEGDCFTIKRFAGDALGCFHDGILLTLIRQGEGRVCAEINGEKLECKVKVRERRMASKEDVLKPYAADLHIHTSHLHREDAFTARVGESAADCIKSVLDSGALDCSVITDHAGLTRRKGMFQAFVEEEETPHEGLVVFPGAESELSVIENDRFGLIRKNSGELVTLNTNSLAEDPPTWEEFYETFADSPFVIGMLNHPNAAGWAQKCIWNFQLHKNAAHPELQRIVKLIELGNGEIDGDRILYHYPYSYALDCGLKVAPSCNSDCHGEYISPSGKTFILAPEKSREMFYDAIVNHRVYACESGAVDLKFTVNGCGMGETLGETDIYQIHVEASLLHPAEHADPVRCDVVSDYGKTLKSVEFSKSTDLTIVSDSARYFYVILRDSKNRKTWSAPVWTGRAFDDWSFLSQLIPVDSSEFTAFDEKQGVDAGILINGNPQDTWEAGDTTASVIIDMKRPHKICGVGHYAPTFYHVDRKSMGAAIADYLLDATSEFVCDYRISVSCDGEQYRECKSGFIRNFGGEEILPFEPVEARYVRFEALSTVGKDTGCRELADKHVKIGELSIFMNQKE